MLYWGEDRDCIENAFMKLTNEVNFFDKETGLGFQGTPELKLKEENL